MTFYEAVNCLHDIQNEVMIMININLLSKEELLRLGLKKSEAETIIKTRPIESMLHLLPGGAVSFETLRRLLSIGVIAGVRDKNLLPIIGTDILFSPVPPPPDDDDEEEGAPQQEGGAPQGGDAQDDDDEEGGLGGGEGEVEGINGVDGAVLGPITDCTTENKFEIIGTGKKKRVGRGYAQERPGVVSTAKTRARINRFAKLGIILDRCTCTDPDCPDPRLTISGWNAEPRLVVDAKYKTRDVVHGTRRGWQATAVATATVSIKCSRLV